MPTDTPDLDAEQDVDLRRHWDTITRHWWIVLAGLAAGLVVGYLISLSGAQVYKAKAVVYLGQPLSQGGVQVQSQATNPSTVKQIVTAEATIQRASGSENGEAGTCFSSQSPCTIASVHPETTFSKYRHGTNALKRNTA